MVKRRVGFSYDRLDDPGFLLRQWTALCIAQMWDCNDEMVYGVDQGTQDKLTGMLAEDSTEVRAAVYALGTFMGASGSSDPNKQGGGGTGTMLQLEESSFPDGGCCSYRCYYRYQRRCKPNVPKGAIDSY